jgi:hypothetical protein
MNINLSHNLVEKIRGALWHNYGLYKLFTKAVQDSVTDNTNTQTIKRDENGRFAPKYRVYKEFVYASKNSGTIKNRLIRDAEMDGEYLTGKDVKDGQIKTFKKSNIIGPVRTIKRKI